MKCFPRILRSEKPQSNLGLLSYSSAKRTRALKVAANRLDNLRWPSWLLVLAEIFD